MRPGAGPYRSSPILRIPGQVWKPRQILLGEASELHRSRLEFPEEAITDRLEPMRQNGVIASSQRRVVSVGHPKRLEGRSGLIAKHIQEFVHILQAEEKFSIFDPRLPLFTQRLGDAIEIDLASTRNPMSLGQGKLANRLDRPIKPGHGIIVAALPPSPFGVGQKIGNHCAG